MSFPSYLQMKHSKHEWLGKLPAHWTIQTLKSLFRIVGGATPKSEVTDFWDGNIAWITPSDLSGSEIPLLKSSQRKITTEGLNSCGTTIVPVGSIVLSTRAPIGSIGISDIELCTNQGCKSLVPLAGVSSSYFAFVISVAKEQLKTRGKGTTFLELSGDELGAFKVCVPSLDEQTAIASFLDRETGKIDDLVNEQKRLIELLKEKRQAVISHAVTKGLDPNVKMKPSGVEWLGDVPEHWEVKQLRHLIKSISSGTSVNAIDTPATENELGVLKTSCVYSGEFNPSENKTIIPEEYPRVSCPVISDTLIVSRMNTPDLVGAAGLSIENLSNIFLPDRLWQIQFCDASAAFVHLWTLTLEYRAQVHIACAGTSSSMQNLSQDQFKAFCLVVPPLQEQLIIVDKIHTEIQRTKEILDQSEAAIKLLLERRSTLISAAVTGRIDVHALTPDQQVAAE